MRATRTVDAAAPRHGAMRAGYESYYLRATAPGGGVGVWLRHTAQVVPGRSPTVSTWFTLFDRSSDGPIALRRTAAMTQQVPVGDVPGGTPAPWLAGAGGSIGPGRTQAALEAASAPPVSWDLSFSGEPPLLHLDRTLLYRAPLPRTKAVSIHPSAAVSGVVSVGDRSLDLDAWPGMIGHNWGSEHAERWIWCHACEFAGPGGVESADSAAWLDVVLARVRVGPVLTPWTVAGAVSVSGRRIVLGGPARSRGARVATRPGGASLRLPGDGVVVDVEISAPLDHFVGWLYTDPGGRGHDVVNCSVADADLRLAVTDRPAVRLRAVGTAAYELGCTSGDPGAAGAQVHT